MNGSLTIELEKLPSLRLVGGVQTQNGLVPHPCVVDKNSVGKSPSPTPGPPAQGSSARKISPHDFWLQKRVGIEPVREASRVPSSSSS